VRTATRWAVGWVTAIDTGVVEPPVAALAVVPGLDGDVDDSIDVAVAVDVVFLSLPPHAAVRVTTATTPAMNARAGRTGAYRTRKEAPEGASFTLAGFVPAVVRRISSK
jgi:hypothetical protein